MSAQVALPLGLIQVRRHNGCRGALRANELQWVMKFRS